MARPKEFERLTALDAAIDVFREHGFAGASTGDLTQAMQIGRQSLYDTFGDKWQLYTAALTRYGARENEAHRAALSTGPRAIDGLDIFLARVRAKAGEGCLSLGAAIEFGRRKPELTVILAAIERALLTALASRVREAQAEGDVAGGLDAREAAAFFAASMSGIRIAARSGAGAAQLQALAELSLRALR
jgi:AcrR family transcriptional regulator